MTRSMCSDISLPLDPPSAEIYEGACLASLRSAPPMNLFQYSDYRDFLRDRLGQRRQLDARYSLRRFALDIGLSPSRLSEVLNGGKGLSATSGAKISQALGLSGDEAAMFRLLIASQNNKSIEKRAQAQAAIIGLRSEKATLKIDSDRYHLIADWYHFPLIELIAISKGSIDEGTYARKLGVPRMEISTALRRLIHLGLIEKRGGKYAVCTRNTKTSHGAVESAAIVKVQTQLLDKAKWALATHTSEEREFGALILAFDSKRMAQAKKRIREFRRRFNAEFAPKGQEDTVACLAMQFHSLLKEQVL